MMEMRQANFRRMLRAGELSVPPLDIRVIQTARNAGEDAVLDVAWRGQSCRYVAQLKQDARPQTLKLATDQARQLAGKSSKSRPMVIVPYLTGEKLDELLGAGVSALDFCGNAAVEAPGRFLFYKSGNPNRYPDSSPIQSAYRGDSSLVARVLLLAREFQAIGDILAAIRERGGSLTMGTVSKVLQRLEADLVIQRPTRNRVRVIQPETLMDGLLEAWQPPRLESMWTGKVSLPAPNLLSSLERLARESDLVRTGESSAGEYAVWAGEPIITCYCRATPALLLNELGAEVKETGAFPNLRLLQTDDQRVYFDRRPKLTASPVQSWLEMASGDKRQKEVAGQIQRLLLDPVGGKP